MTTDLEKQFYTTFGIEPKITGYEIHGVGHKVVSQEPIYDYPQITDRILLELICIDFDENPYKCRGGVDMTNIKEYILNEFIREYENNLYRDKQNIKQQVQALFKEER